MHLKRKILPFLTTSIDMRVVGTADVPTAPLTSDYSKNCVTKYFSLSKEHHTHTDTHSCLVFTAGHKMFSAPEDTTVST